MGLLSKKKTPNPEELYNACKTNNRAEVTRLIDAKCDPQAHADPFTGDVCLHVCANKNRYELMETLLKAGADADKQNKVSRPPPIERGSPHTQLLLVIQGASSVNVRLLAILRFANAVQAK